MLAYHNGFFSSKPQNMIYYKLNSSDNR